MYYQELNKQKRHRTCFQNEWRDRCAIMTANCVPPLFWLKSFTFFKSINGRLQTISN